MRSRRTIAVKSRVESSDPGRCGRRRQPDRDISATALLSSRQMGRFIACG